MPSAIAKNTGPPIIVIIPIAIVQPKNLWMLSSGWSGRPNKNSASAIWAIVLWFGKFFQKLLLLAGEIVWEGDLEANVEIAFLVATKSI